MEVIYKIAQSNKRPLEIDITSSNDGVYVRRDIKEVEIELEDGEILKRFEYQEAFLSKSE